MLKKKKLPENEESKQETVEEVLEVEEKISPEIVEAPIIEAEIKEIPQEVPVGVIKIKEFDKDSWKPITDLGKKVKSGEIKNIDEILDKGLKILEPEIVDILLPDLQSDLLAIGQSKGKFGGGKRSIWRQTQKKTKEGNKPKFATLAVVGNKNGYVGIGYGKSKETVPAREKAIKQAKLNIIKIRRGCGSWECNCGQPHSIPFKTIGKTASIQIKLLPAPKGTGITTEKEIKKMIELAGIKDIYSKSRGQTRTKINFIFACFKALKQLTNTKVKHDLVKKLGIIEGKLE
ncbi:MAG: 30S ribosomal protein S5 [Candidatus Woesearchaeota archaeon]|nr:30S ribosomal protein S5 [Candidatus Woesearchaeota archaeon]